MLENLQERDLADTHAARDTAHARAARDQKPTLTGASVQMQLGALHQGHDLHGVHMAAIQAAIEEHLNLDQGALQGVSINASRGGVILAKVRFRVAVEAVFL